MVKKTAQQKFTAAMLRAGAAAIDGMNALSPIEMARAVLHAAFTPQRPKRKAPAKRKSPVKTAKRKIAAKKKAVVRKVVKKKAKRARKAA